jgi:hypothetical protein
VAGLSAPVDSYQGFSMQVFEMFWLSLVLLFHEQKLILICQCCYLSPGPGPGLMSWWNAEHVYSMLIIAVMIFLYLTRVINDYKLKKQY